MWHPWKRRIAELRARVEQLAEQRDDARRELANSRATVIRLTGRNTELTERLERAHEAAQDGALDEMGHRLDRALRACARYRKEVAEDQAATIAAIRQLKEKDAEIARARAAGRADVVRELELCKRARRDLAGQLATVQASNDFMCREAVDRAGNLAIPKPGEVTA